MPGRVGSDNELFDEGVSFIDVRFLLVWWFPVESILAMSVMAASNRSRPPAEFKCRFSRSVSVSQFRVSCLSAACWFL
ncbi:hypothetical protein, partial [Streptomyces huasconensis]|uniref:hypothetical protein n=1 Tax=Streptomyces huasconensis TaxID=1854574 RepID=UPI0036FDD50D